MKKFIIAFLAIAFLLPAFAYAGSYCVSFPTSGGSIMTKRDNTAGVRFRYDYDRGIAYERGTGGRRIERGAFAFKPDFFGETGYLKGSGNVSRNGGYKYYGNGTSDLCIDDDSTPYGTEVEYKTIEGRHTIHAEKAVHHHHAVPLKQVRLDVKFGGDCGTVTVDTYGHFNDDHRFEVYRRKGDLVNPWGCRRK